MGFLITVEYQDLKKFRLIQLLKRNNSTYIEKTDYLIIRQSDGSNKSTTEVKPIYQDFSNIIAFETSLLFYLIKQLLIDEIESMNPPNDNFRDDIETLDYDPNERFYRFCFHY